MSICGLIDTFSCMCVNIRHTYPVCWCKSLILCSWMCSFICLCVRTVTSDKFRVSSHLCPFSYQFHYFRKTRMWTSTLARTPPEIFFMNVSLRGTRRRKHYYFVFFFLFRVPKSVKTERHVRIQRGSLIVSLVDDVRKEKRFKSERLSTIWAVANLRHGLDECSSLLSLGNLPMWRIRDLTYRRVIAQQLWSVTSLTCLPAPLPLPLHRELLGVFNNAQRKKKLHLDLWVKLSFPFG